MEELGITTTTHEDDIPTILENDPMPNSTDEIIENDNATTAVNGINLVVDHRNKDDTLEYDNNQTFLALGNSSNLGNRS